MVAFCCAVASVTNTRQFEWQIKSIIKLPNCPSLDTHLAIVVVFVVVHSSSGGESAWEDKLVIVNNKNPWNVTSNWVDFLCLTSDQIHWDMGMGCSSAGPSHAF